MNKIKGLLLGALGMIPKTLAVYSLSKKTANSSVPYDMTIHYNIFTLFQILVLCKNFSQPAVVSTSDISNSDGTNHHPDTKLLPNRVLMP